MDLYVILRRSGWRDVEELGEAAARSTAEGERMFDDVRWIRSYVLEEGSRVGTVCIYEASSPEAIRAHARAADLPVDEIVRVADTVVVRPDPQPAAVQRPVRPRRGGTTMTRSFLIAAAAAALAAALVAGPAAAHSEPTCAGLGGIANHAQHVLGDYVTGLGGIGGGLQWPPAGQVGQAVKANGGAAVPGGPGPGFHFTVDGLAPGASFCNPQAHPEGFKTPRHFGG